MLDPLTPTTNTSNITPAVTLNDIKGKLAVPIDNGYGLYNLHIFSMPDGQQIANIENARQPSFRLDGKKLLINREGGGLDQVTEYDITDGTEKQVSGDAKDWHPFYDPWGNRVVYGNDQLAFSGITTPKIENGQVQRHNKTGRVIYQSEYAPFIFVQCGLQPPHIEEDMRCRDIAVFRILVPAGQMGDLRGTHPVWSSDDYIVYKGCNTWAGSASCGIYKVQSSSTKAYSDGFIPRQLTRDTSDTPSDTKGNWIAFSSQQDGDWEAYLMDLNGDNLINLSNNPNANDGLPTISPDQNWVAFVSDRTGQWAVWVTPISGGAPQKLFDLPTNTPWGDGDRSWLTERISWAP